MRGLSLDQLRALAEVAETGSFTEAALRLNLTQPAISLRYASSRAASASPSSNAWGSVRSRSRPDIDLIEHGRRMITEADRALATMRRHKDGRVGRVHLGTVVTALTYLLPPVLRRLRAAHPDIELVITTGTTDYIVEQMLANLIDLGFITLPADARIFEVTAIRRDPLLAILPASERNVLKRYQASGTGEAAAHTGNYEALCPTIRGTRRIMRAADFDPNRR